MFARPKRNNDHANRPRNQDACAELDPPAFHLGYRRWLDGLRGLAIMAVLGGHLSLFWGGSLGVDAFFVLSGFLITTLLVEEWQMTGAVSLRRFYIRRCLRLQPALFALIVFGLLFTNFYRPDDAAAFRQQSIVAATYMTNWPNVHVIPMTTLGHTWSLAIEEQFYLVWPILLYGMLRAGLGTRQIIKVVLAGTALAAGFRLLIYTIHVPTPEGNLPTVYWLLMSSHTRADALLIGCAVGLFAAFGLIPQGRWFLRVTGLLSLVVAAAVAYMVWSVPRLTPAYFQGLFTVFAAMVAIVLLRLLAGPSWIGRWILGSAPLVAAGRLSYSLYLVHVPVLEWVPHGDLGLWQMANVTMMLTAIIAAALVSYFLVERPFLRLKRRFETKLTTLQVAAVPVVSPPLRIAA